MTDFSLLLGAFDVAAAFLTIVCMQVVTPGAGLTGPHNRWSALRRLVYSVVSMALFIKGAYRLEGSDFVPWYEALSQIVIVGGFLFFPGIKALQIKSSNYLFSSFRLLGDQNGQG